MIKSIMKMYIFFIQLNFQWFFFVFEKISSSIPMFLVMLLPHLGKRSKSRSQMFSKTGVLKNFAIFTGKKPCSVEKVFLKNSHNSQENNCVRILYLNKVAGLRPATLFKKKLCRQVFSCRFYEIFQSTFLQNTSGSCCFFQAEIARFY